MPIDSRCHGCGKTLRVADEHIGKKARCPGCGSVYVVRTTDAAIPIEPKLTTRETSGDSPIGSSHSNLDTLRPDAGQQIGSNSNGSGNLSPNPAGRENPNSTYPYGVSQSQTPQGADPYGVTESHSVAQPYSTQRSATIDMFAELPDGNIYGPTDVAGIHRWIREGRLNAQCRIRSSNNQFYSLENFKLQFAEQTFSENRAPTAEPVLGETNDSLTPIAEPITPLSSPQSVYAQSDSSQPNPFAGPAKHPSTINSQTFYGPDTHGPQSALGTAAFVVAICGFAVACIPIVGQILAVTASVMAGTELMKLRDGRPKPPNHGLTVAALVIGLLQLVLSGFWLVATIFG